MECTINKSTKPLAPPSHPKLVSGTKQACTLKARLGSTPQRDFSFTGPSPSSFLSLPKPEQLMAAVPHRQGQCQVGGWAGRSPYRSLTYHRRVSKETQTSWDGKGAVWKEGVRCSGQGDKMAASAIGGKRALRPLAACDLPSRSSAGVRGSGVRAAAAPHSGHWPRPWGSGDGCQKKYNLSEIQSLGAFMYLRKGTRPSRISSVHNSFGFSQRALRQVQSWGFRAWLSLFVSPLVCGALPESPTITAPSGAAASSRHTWGFPGRMLIWATWLHLLLAVLTKFLYFLAVLLHSRPWKIFFLPNAFTAGLLVGLKSLDLKSTKHQPRCLKSGLFCYNYKCTIHQQDKANIRKLWRNHSLVWFWFCGSSKEKKLQPVFYKWIKIYGLRYYLYWFAHSTPGFSGPVEDWSEPLCPFILHIKLFFIKSILFTSVS